VTLSFGTSIMGPRELKYLSRAARSCAMSVRMAVLVASPPLPWPGGAVTTLLLRLVVGPDIDRRLRFWSAT
jgi:hypothetical protein